MNERLLCGKSLKPFANHCLIFIFSSKLKSKILLYNQAHVCGVRQMLSDTIRVHTGEMWGECKSCDRNLRKSFEGIYELCSTVSAFVTLL